MRTKEDKRGQKRTNERLETHADGPASERLVAMAIAIPCDETVTGGPRALPRLVRCGPMQERRQERGVAQDVVRGSNQGMGRMMYRSGITRRDRPRRVGWFAEEEGKKETEKKKMREMDAESNRHG